MYTNNELTLSQALHVALNCEENLHHINLIYCYQHTAFTSATFIKSELSEADKMTFELLSDCSVSLCLFGPEDSRIATIYVNVDD